MDLKLENLLNSTIDHLAQMPKNENMVRDLPWPVKIKKEIFTTREKLEGLKIVKAILRETVDINRVTYRDTLSYFVIQLDGTSRKTICRLYLDNRKYLVLLREDKTQIRHRLANIDELYKFAYLIRPVVIKMEEDAAKAEAEAGGQ